MQYSVKQPQGGAVVNSLVCVPAVFMPSYCHLKMLGFLLQLSMRVRMQMAGAGMAGNKEVQDYK